jgi:hypothetical protein
VGVGRITIENILHLGLPSPLSLAFDTGMMAPNVMQCMYLALLLSSFLLYALAREMAYSQICSSGVGI